MSDWYDKLISVLGLDESRTDRLIGTPESQLLELPAPYYTQPVTVMLHRLLDGRRLLILQFGSLSHGELWPWPCSPANAVILDTFLTRANAHLPAAEVAGEPHFRLADLFRRWFTRGETVEGMEPLVHRHFEARLGLRLARFGNSCLFLHFNARSGGSRSDFYWPWSRSLSADWQRLQQGIQDASNEWPPEHAREPANHSSNERTHSQTLPGA